MKSKQSRAPNGAFGPSIYVMHQHGGTRSPQQLLSPDERRRLALLASIQHFEAGEFLFHEGDPATTVYNIISGVAKSVALLEDGRQVVVAFFLNHDLLGMFEERRYAQSAQAITPLTVYSMPIDALEGLLRRDPDLQLHFLCKLSHELRAAQRQAIMLGKFSAVQRVALLLDFLDRHPQMHEYDNEQIMIPMDRADIADYVGLRIESVSRVLQKLHRDRVIHVDGRHRFRILDRDAFNRALGSRVVPPEQIHPGQSATM
jgi:CRP/FNR family transcriptional regulator